MNVITPPNTDLHSDLFLAGGISNCPNWQKYVLDQLKDLDITICNPRNSQYEEQKELFGDEKAAVTQIEWEFYRLERASTILFWFPCETLCPITLFELGKFCDSYCDIFVGCHPDYKRKLDVVTQLKLVSNVEVVSSLDELIEQVRSYWSDEE